MKKNYKETPLVDEYLQSISGMKAAETDPFFYTRLKARMENELIKNQPIPNFKLAFVACTLAILLSINCWILFQTNSTQKHEVNISAPQNFADAYGIGNSFSY